MRAVTLTQPWAGLVVAGLKLIENRERPIIAAARFGEPTAIHASREIDEDVYERIAEIAPDVLQIVDGVKFVPCQRDWVRLSRITSAVLGVVVPRRVVRAVMLHPEHGYGYSSHEIAELGDQRRWLFGRFGYVFDRDPRVLAKPVPCKGALGCWQLPPAIAAQVEAQLS